MDVVSARTDPFWEKDCSSLGRIRGVTTDGDPLTPLYGVPMPSGRQRPLWHGLPIPYTALVIANEERPELARPCLKMASPEKLGLCRSENRCIHCGEPLDEQAVIFWEGESGTVADDALHPDCARLVAAHCPHIRDSLAAGRCRPYVISVASLRLWFAEQYLRPAGPWSPPEGASPTSVARRQLPLPGD